LFLDNATIEGARLRRIVHVLPLPQDYPTLRDWIATDFHAEF
jgi:hypothetical protein